MSVKQELATEMKCKLIHDLLKDHAQEYFRNLTDNKVSNYDGTINNMDEEYWSNVKMETIARKLETLHISQLEDKERSEDAALKNWEKTPRSQLSVTDRLSH